MEKITRFTQEDIETRDAIGIVVRDTQGKILIQDHVKLDFFTIPIGKLKSGEDMKAKVSEEMSEEHGIKVQECEKIGSCEWLYDYDGIKIRITTHIFEILSFTGEIKNNEPLKHRSIKFMNLDEIRSLPRISDATKYLLSLN